MTSKSNRPTAINVPPENKQPSVSGSPDTQDPKPAPGSAFGDR
ncbi:hypothetical protein BH20ACT5_BH20ACT5_18980 [soil metagenome]